MQFAGMLDEHPSLICIVLISEQEVFCCFHILATCQASCTIHPPYVLEVFINGHISELELGYVASIGSTELRTTGQFQEFLGGS